MQPPHQILANALDVDDGEQRRKGADDLLRILSHTAGQAPPRPLMATNMDAGTAAVLEPRRHDRNDSEGLAAIVCAWAGKMGHSGESEL
jgi:hypothetical protein